MLNRRQNVFETNSSSVHTITLDTGCTKDLILQKDGYVHLSLPYYGKHFDSFNNSYDKLCYAILIVCYTHHIYLEWNSRYEEFLDEAEYEEEMTYWRDSLQDLLDTPEYNLIESCVVEEFYKQDKVCYGLKIHQSDECGIDHQSQDHESLEEFLQENNIKSIHEFIFGCYTLNTGCD